MPAHVSHRLPWRYRQKPRISADVDVFRGAFPTVDDYSVSHGWHMDRAVCSASVSNSIQGHLLPRAADGQHPDGLRRIRLIGAFTEVRRGNKLCIWFALVESILPYSFQRTAGHISASVLTA
jgi:hypothetical protein